MKLINEQILQSGLKYTKELQITLDDDFNVPDSKPDIDSIVKEWGNVYIDSAKVIDSSVQIRGNLDFALLYSGKSDIPGLIVPVKMTGGINFTENVNLPDEHSNGNLGCIARIDDLTIKSINSRKISVRAIVTLIVNCYSEEWKDFGCEIDNEHDNSIQTKIRKLSYTEMCVNMKDNLRIRQNISLPAGHLNIGEVKWEDLSVRNINSYMTDEGMVVSGELVAFVMYEPDADSPKIQWYEGSASFEEKLDISGSSQDMICFVKYNTVSCNVEPKANYDGEIRDLGLELVLELDVKGFMDKEKDIIEDVYSPSRNISLESEDVTLSHLIMRNNSRCKVNSKVDVKDNNMMQIINSNATAQIDSINTEEDGITVEGVLIASVMYVTSVDSSPINSISDTIPFSHKISMNTGGTDTANNIEISVENINAVMTGNGEIEIKGTIAIDAVCFEHKTVRAVTKCEYEEFNQEEYLKFPCIVGYISNGRDNLWTVAKNNHTTVDIIKQENKNLPEHSESDYVIPVREKLLLIKAASN